jgi:hypothetical protein
MRASDSSFEAVSSAFELKDGALAYMPSWNFWLPEEVLILAAVPHETNAVAVAMISSKLFFILFFSYL